MRKRKWVLAGGDTLAGMGVREYIEEHHLPVVLISTSSMPEERVLTGQEGEIAVLDPLDDAAVDGAEALLLAASEEVNLKAVALAGAVSPRPAVIDLTGQFESRPEARLRAPGIEAAPREAGDAIEIVAHPAAVALVKLMRALKAAAPLRSVVVTIHEPASARGKEALDELHQQTISLFNFTAQPKKVFDIQASFNLLPRLGREAPPPSLESTQRRIEQHLTTLAAPEGLPSVSLRVVQAPVFHGYCQSVWVEFESRPEVSKVESQLRHAGAEVHRADEDPASNVSAVGQSGIMVSDIAPDRANPRAMWVWLASDNLRTLAETAVLLAGMSHREAA
jgi:aspartate-semialdehyde dehydrogenase